MSKYNHTKSIPIDCIPKTEIARAVKEWAEGDDALERLLWACYERGIRTSGCHAGAGPYIDFNYQDKISQHSRLIEVAQKIKGSQVLLNADGGNPFSGPEWYAPGISLGFDTQYKEEADICFDRLTESLEIISKKEEKHILIKLLEFLIGKESGLLLRFRHTEEDKYEFYIEAFSLGDNKNNYYNELFTKAGLEEVPVDKDFSSLHMWKIESDSLKDISRQMESIIDYIINNYSLKLPTSENEIYSFRLKAIYMKRTLSEEQFEKWLNKMKKEMFKRRIRLFGKRQKNSNKKTEIKK